MRGVERKVLETGAMIRMFDHRYYKNRYYK